MALFDNLSKKLTEAGQTAVQKTKELSDITRINSAIAEEEKRINNSYYQIGKLYTAIHISDYESDFAGMIQAIKESENKIREYRQQIQEIKGVVRCEKCGAEVPSNAAFCSACGNSMPKVEKTVDTNLVRCDGCGAMIDKNMRFCTSCGKAMADMSQTEVVVEKAEQAIVVEEIHGKKCPNCGAELAEELAFCTECGAKLK